jgi:hypothetical protein
MSSLSRSGTPSTSEIKIQKKPGAAPVVPAPKANELGVGDVTSPNELTDWVRPANTYTTNKKSDIAP